MPVGLRAAGADLALASAECGDRVVEVLLELVAVVGQEALELPTGLAQAAGDAAREAAGLALVGAGPVAANQFGPREAAVGVDRGELPDRVARAVQAPDVKQSMPTSSPGCVLVMCGSGDAWRAGS